MDFSTLNGESFNAGGYSPTQPGASQPTQSFMTPSPKKSSSEKPEAHGVLPVTIKAYREHMDSCEKDTVTIFGLPAAKVVVVGVVKSCDIKATSSTFVVDDNTGLVKAQNWQHNRKEVSEGQVVRVVAAPRPASGADANLSVIHCSVIPEHEAAEAMGFHMIQSCLAQCQTSARGVPMDDLTPEKEGAQTIRPGVAPATQSPVKASGAELTGAALQNAIKDCIRGFPTTEEGFAVTRIADALAKSAKPALVKSAIDEMVEDGSLFNVEDGFVLLSED
jgi:hypothetical protein